LSFSGEIWREQANCKKLGPSIFFSENEDGALSRKNDANAKRVCGDCAVKTNCLSYALNEQISFGIWGGFTARERSSIIRKFGLDDYTTISSELVNKSLHMIKYKN
jgi:WhiB family redox-sensing transcriptional regulator